MERAEFQPPSETPIRPALLLQSGIRFIIVPGKGVELKLNPDTQTHEVVATEASELAAAALGLVHETNSARPEFENLTAIVSGKFTVSRKELKKVQFIGPKTTEAEAMSTIAQRVGSVPPAAIWEDHNATYTEENAINAARMLAGEDTEGTVATITDKRHRLIVLRRLRAHGINVQQAMLFEDILRDEPDYAGRIRTYEENAGRILLRVSGLVYLGAYETRLGRSAMHWRAENTRGEGKLAPVFQEELVANQ
ncbi:MAG: YdcF family protein [Candidatus Levybacteria bacterium]|nr:YdcF family protein [Candidatus Levybacteria bacterium]